MRCHYHADDEAIGACAMCGHPLCERCVNERDRVFYCESCLAEKEGVGNTGAGEKATPKIELPRTSAFSGEPPPPAGKRAKAAGAKKPGTAALLSIVLPSAGQIYNGQYAKALTYLLLIISCAVLADQSHPMEGLFGVIAAFIYFYQIYDAYKTARDINESRCATALVPMLTGTDEGYRDSGPSARSADSGPSAAATGSSDESPVWGISLIVLGCIFLLQNFNLIAFNTLLRLWPLFVVATGLAMILSFMRRSRG
jgi:hypothetical protein